MPTRSDVARRRRGSHREHTVFTGSTSGAAYPANAWARNNPDPLSAVIFPDEGYRCQDRARP